MIEVTRIDGTYRIANIDPGLDVKLNGRQIKPNKGIHDGDEIWIGPAGPSIHFFPIAATHRDGAGPSGRRSRCAFIEQAAMEASATARRDDAKIFCASSPASWSGKSIPAPRSLFSPSSSLPWSAPSTSASLNSMKPGAAAAYRRK